MGCYQPVRNIPAFSCDKQNRKLSLVLWYLCTHTQTHNTVHHTHTHTHTHTQFSTPHTHIIQYTTHKHNTVHHTHTRSMCPVTVGSCCCVLMSLQYCCICYIL